MLEKTLTIDGQEVKFKNSAAIPRMYRLAFKQDILLDMARMRDEIEKTNGDLPIEVLTIFEQVAYVMAKHGDPSIPNTIDEWLEGFNSFNIYEILPEILEMWSDGIHQMSSAKKPKEQ